MAKEFEIDVSGSDLLSKDYTICIANKDSFIHGFKLSEELINILSSKYGQGLYRYNKSKKGKSDFKVRLYCAVIYYIFRSSKISGEISLKVCRDFPGKEGDIKENLKMFLERGLGLILQDRLYFGKLTTNSNAHRYAYLMRQDTKNQMPNYIKISLEELEKWLIKK